MADGVAREKDGKAIVIVENMRSIQLFISSPSHSRPAGESLRLWSTIVGLGTECRSIYCIISASSRSSRTNAILRGSSDR